jgi:hypothetical protein
VVHGSNECGSVACIIGWIPEFDKTVTRDGNYLKFEGYGKLNYIEVGSLFFDISNDHSHALFTPHEQCEIEGMTARLNERSTPSDAANVLREYVALCDKCGTGVRVGINALMNDYREGRINGSEDILIGLGEFGVVTVNWHGVDNEWNMAFTPMDGNSIHLSHEDEVQIKLDMLHEIHKQYN